MLNYLPLSEDQFLILKNLYYSFNNYIEIANILKISKSAVCCHIKEYISLEYDIKKDPESVKIFLKTLLPV